jgi:hypothetical protein
MVTGARRGDRFGGLTTGCAQSRDYHQHQGNYHDRKLFHWSASFIWLFPIAFDDIYVEGEKVLQGSWDNSQCLLVSNFKNDRLA